MHTVVPGDKNTVPDGLIVEEAQNRGVGVFSPDLFFDHLVNNYRMAEQLYGEKLLRLITGYSGAYLERNLRLPEFKKVLKQQLTDNIQKLEDTGMLDKDGKITAEGFSIGALAVVLEELNMPAGTGLQETHKGKTAGKIGERDDTRTYHRGDTYRDINVRKTISQLIKHGKTAITPQDLIISTRKHTGTVNIIYALDSSASMKGTKLHACRRAGIALAYRALQRKDKVGIIIFGERVKDAVAPTTDFSILAEKMMHMTATRQTNFVDMIQHASELLTNQTGQKHVLILSDALPTSGTDPKEDAKRVIANAHSQGITFSLIGVKLNTEGLDLARHLVELGGGKLYQVNDAGEVKGMVLEEYERITSNAHL
ncbi:VWA domain-containing protein [Candidatus Woesearchaeota archaeon]|nr:VWA domain-containing protein [Candidatus Woesearchaeota archaeon]